MKNRSKKPMNNFKQLLWSNGFTDTSVKGNENIAEFFGVTSRTIRNWIKNDRAPNHAIDKLNNKHKHLNKHWNGFVIEQEKIKTPNGYEFTANEIKTLTMKIEALKNLIE